MTSGRQGAAPRSARGVAGRSRDGKRLTPRVTPRAASKRERLARAFYWRGWKTVGAVATSAVAISTAGVAIATYVVAERTLQANTRQQTSERFVKAVEQLGNDKSPDVRIGGVYGLEQLARDAQSEQPVVFDVLAAFVRGHASRDDTRLCPPDFVPVVPVPVTAEIQTVIDVIARRDRRYDQSDRLIDLSLTCLVGLDLRRRQLPGIRMSYAKLPYAVLEGADLQGTILDDSDLSKSYAVGADLKSAKLRAALLVADNLTGADLRGANLTGANLTGANLTGAKLSGALLGDANLSGALLGDANLSGADLRDIDYDASTQWPEGFQHPPSRPH